ncbi:hypothetical protein F4780DRAFT_614981 [Xylariomycetidae sp. FL0641]|nr:hypothetical protein F4780DRAFT_614981 [Xylariomycetidae sp. FL0641]
MSRWPGVLVLALLSNQATPSTPATRRNSPQPNPLLLSHARRTVEPAPSVGGRRSSSGRHRCLKIRRAARSRKSSPGQLIRPVSDLVTLAVLSAF